MPSIDVNASKAAFAAILCLAGAVYAGEGPLVLSIECDASPILRYEPVPLRMVLTNTGDHPVTITKRLKWVGQNYATSLLVAYQDGPYKQWKRRWEPYVGIGGGYEKTLAPDRSVSLALECYWQKMSSDLRKRQRYHYGPFDKLGEYRLKARWEGSRGVLESEPLKVRVVKGTQADRACLKQLLRRDLRAYLSLHAGVFMDISSKKKSKIRRKLLQTAREFEDSEYSLYCASALLTTASEDEKDEAFRQKVVNLVEDRIQERPGARILTLYSNFLSRIDPHQALTWLQAALSFDPDEAALTLAISPDER